jgi:hypothetical protein
MGVRGEAERRSGLHAHLRECAGGIDFSHRLAQAGGGHLDRDPALGDRLDGGLVVEARVALGPRTLRPPDLDEVRVGKHVVDPAERGLRKRREVERPDAIRVADRLPDVPDVVVHGLIPHEVDGPDHVVEVVGIQEVRDAVLPPGYVVHLDPQPKRRGPHEVRVRAEVVPRALEPERMIPDR